LSSWVYKKTACLILKVVVGKLLKMKKYNFD